MAYSIKKYLKVWGIQIKNGVMLRMAYPLNFVLMGLAVFLQMLLTIVFIKVIFGFINDISGWSYGQAMVVVASYMLIEGLMWTTCSYLAGLSRNIRLGTMDYILIKPMDPQFLVSVWQADPEDWARVATAAIVFIYAFKNLEISLFHLSLNFIFYLVLIISAYIIVYSITLIIKSVSFWVIDTTSLWSITENITKMSQYPTDIFFHKAAQIIFSTIIPLAFIATVPAKILIHGPRLDLIVFSLTLAIIFFYSSRKFWLFALKHYSGASS